jgi:hypothetical protein
MGDFADDPNSALLFEKPNQDACRYGKKVAWVLMLGRPNSATPALINNVREDVSAQVETGDPARQVHGAHSRTSPPTAVEVLVADT